MAETQFEWIVAGYGVPIDNKATRKRVRTHAMKATAASRKKTGTWGKRNLRQLPIRLDAANGAAPDETSPTNGKTAEVADAPLIGGSKASDKSASKPKSQPLTRLNIQVPLTGLELMTAELGLNVLDLSALTSVHFGPSASSLLDTQPFRLQSLLGCRRFSYLSYVPTRFGNTPCLDDALRCVALKARRVLVPYPDPTDSHSKELALYGRALRSLQSAVDQLRDGVDTPDVLCAIELLGLFELLGGASERAWGHHVAGAARIIRMRGPDNFKTDFDKSLLLTMTGPIVFESMRKNEECFLEGELWQDVLRSLIIKDSSFALRGEMNITLTCMVCRVPQLFRDVTLAVADPDAMSTEATEDLIGRLRRYRSDLTAWRLEYNSLLLAAPSWRRNRTDPDNRTELLGTSLVLSMHGCRLLAALCVDNIDILEDDAVTYATQMMKLEADITPTNGWAGFYLSHKLAIPSAILNTSEIWRDNPRGSGAFLERWRFKTWCNLLGRESFPDE